MKRFVAITVCVSLMLALAGCYGPQGKQAKKPKITLPPEVAGTWQAEGQAWRIVLTPDGKVSSAVIPMSEVEVRPNKTTKVLMRDKSISTYKAGDCTVDYDPVSRELFVSVRMESIHVKFADERIDGNSLDRFVGPVSADGKVWNADWMTIFDYGPRFPQDLNEPSMANPLIFDKVR